MVPKSAESPKQVRQHAGWSLAKAAVVAGVSEPTARLYEVDPVHGVKNDAKRRALALLYARLRDLPAARPSPVDSEPPPRAA